MLLSWEGGMSCAGSSHPVQDRVCCDVLSCASASAGIFPRVPGLGLVSLLRSVAVPAWDEQAGEQVPAALQQNPPQLLSSQGGSCWGRKQLLTQEPPGQEAAWGIWLICSNPPPSTPPRILLFGLHLIFGDLESKVVCP